MKALLLLLVLAVVVVVVAKVRFDAKRDRTAVLTRLSNEATSTSTGALSPTEALFLAEGVPVPDALRMGLAAPPPTTSNPLQAAAGLLQRARPGAVATLPEPTPVDGPPPAAAPPPRPDAQATDLSDMLEGIEMPPQVEPLAMVGGDGVNCTVATFTAPEEARPGLAAALGAELVRIGCGVQWIDGSTALVRRGAGVAVVTIYDRPDQQLAADGTPRLGDVPAGRLVVQLTAG